MRARDGDAIAACLSDNDVRSTLLVGSTDRVNDQLWQMKTSLVDQVTIRPYALDGESFASTVRGLCRARLACRPRSLRASVLNLLRCPRVERTTQAVAHEVEADHRARDSEAGKQG